MNDPHISYLKEYNNDEYEDRDYNGIFIFPLEGKNYVAKMRWTREGMMREFYDPVSGNYLGCCGSNIPIESIFEFTSNYLFKDRPILVNV